MDFDQIKVFINLCFNPGTFEAIQNKIGLGKRDASNLRSYLIRRVKLNLPKLRSNFKRINRLRLRHDQVEELHKIADVARSAAEAEKYRIKTGGQMWLDDQRS